MQWVSRLVRGPECVGAVRYVEVRACLDQFHNQQNKLELLWEPRLLHSWMAALFCRFKTRDCLCTYTYTYDLSEGAFDSARTPLLVAEIVSVLHICSLYHQSPANYCISSLSQETMKSLIKADGQTSPTGTVYLTCAATAPEARRNRQPRPISDLLAAVRQNIWVPVVNLISVIAAPVEGMSCQKCA